MGSEMRTGKVSAAMSSKQTVPEDPFRALKLEYLEGARAKAEELLALVTTLPQNADTIVALRKVAHNLRGSGGFYGFHQITAAAAMLEELALSAMEGAVLAEGALARAAQALIGAIQSAELP